MGRLELAQRIRRTRRNYHAAAHLRRGDGEGQRPDACERPRHHVGRADFNSAGHRGAEEAVHPQDICPPKKSGAKDTLNPTPAPTWLRCKRAPSKMATASSSM